MSDVTENKDLSVVPEEPEVLASSEEQNQGKKKEKKKKTGWEIALEYILTIVITAAVCFLFIKFVAVRSVVDGSSMYPTLSNGDNLVVQKISYYFHDPERFDVVVFQLADDPKTQEDESKTHYIKRVIGLPGETVEIKSDGYVYINGERLVSDKYGPLIERPGLASKPVTLKEGEFFVLGDNRNNSRDSRAIGPITKSQLLGKAFLRFWPLSSISIVGK
ncbi:MAG: signal peptidase I [Clostridia bacterium]|nr:signal peptidase I [Clostridia bacterium]